MKVEFYEQNDTMELKFAVIPAKYKGQWVFCKHKDRDTYECPGGHHEKGEVILETAKRELYEETGAISFRLYQIGVYGVTADGETTYGMLCFADILELGELPQMEIEEVRLFEKLPEHWTYPSIQPILMKRVKEFLSSKVYLEESQSHRENLQ